MSVGLWSYIALGNTLVRDEAPTVVLHRVRQKQGRRLPI